MIEITVLLVAGFVIGAIYFCMALWWKYMNYTEWTLDVIFALVMAIFALLCGIIGAIN